MNNSDKLTDISKFIDSGDIKGMLQDTYQGKSLLEKASEQIDEKYLQRHKPYVNSRWNGGHLSNKEDFVFYQSTIRSEIDNLQALLKDMQDIHSPKDILLYVRETGLHTRKNSQAFLTGAAMNYLRSELEKLAVNFNYLQIDIHPFGTLTVRNTPFMKDSISIDLLENHDTVPNVVWENIYVDERSIKHVQEVILKTKGELEGQIKGQKRLNTFPRYFTSGYAHKDGMYDRYIIGLKKKIVSYTTDLLEMQLTLQLLEDGSIEDIKEKIQEELNTLYTFLEQELEMKLTYLTS